MMLRAWPSTVRSEMNSRDPICLLVMPWPTSLAASASRRPRRDGLARSTASCEPGNGSPSAAAIASCSLPHWPAAKSASNLAVPSLAAAHWLASASSGTRGGRTRASASALIASEAQRGVPLLEAYVAFFAAGFCSAWSPVGTLFAPYLGELLTPGAVGRSLGVVVLGGMVGSAVAQPVTAALVIHTASGPQYWPAFLLFAACGIISCICVAGMIEPRVRRTYLGYLLSGRREGPWAPDGARRLAETADDV